jgi:hypothetical protein
MLNLKTTNCVTTSAESTSESFWSMRWRVQYTSKMPMMKAKGYLIATAV